MGRLNHSRSHQMHSGTSAGFRDATSIEEAALGIKLIQNRQRAEYGQQKAAERAALAKAKITLSPVLNEWLKKEIP